MDGRTASTTAADGGACGAAASEDTVRVEEEVDAMELWWRWLKSLASRKLFGTLMSGTTTTLQLDWTTDNHNDRAIGG